MFTLSLYRVHVMVLVQLTQRSNSHVLVRVLDVRVSTWNGLSQMGQPHAYTSQQLNSNQSKNNLDVRTEARGWSSLVLFGNY